MKKNKQTVNAWMVWTTANWQWVRVYIIYMYCCVWGWFVSIMNASMYLLVWGGGSIIYFLFVDILVIAVEVRAREWREQRTEWVPFTRVVCTICTLSYTPREWHCTKTQLSAGSWEYLGPVHTTFSGFQLMNLWSTEPTFLGPEPSNQGLPK